MNSLSNHIGCANTIDDVIEQLDEIISAIKQKAN